MLCFWVILCLIVIFTVKIHRGINIDYLSKENSQVLKGIFILIVFLSHIRGYAIFDSYGDSVVIRILSYLGQLMVAYFLFVSGYGVLESVKIKGQSYIRNMPKNRIGKTFFDFSLAIILFFIVDLILGRSYSGQTVALAFIGWTSVGNSSWYMFAIFTLYIISYICFSVFSNSKKMAVVAVSILSLIYIYIMADLQDHWWSDTYLCYAAGMWLSLFKGKIDAFLKKAGTKGWIVIAIAITMCYLYISEYRHVRIMLHNISAVIFCLLLVIFSMKITFKSYFLEWCGKNLFWLYILQRLPMIVLQYFEVNTFNVYLYLLLCFGGTLLLALVMNKITQIILKTTCWG